MNAVLSMMILYFRPGLVAAYLGVKLIIAAVQVAWELVYKLEKEEAKY